MMPQITEFSLFLQPNYIFFIYVSFDGHLDYFHVVAIVKNAAEPSGGWGGADIFPRQ